MKTTIVTKDGVQGAAVKANDHKIKTQNRPNIPGKEAKNEPANDEKPAQAPKAAETQTSEVQPANPATAEYESVKPATQPGKPELKLEDKLKAVNELHRITIQRDNLLHRIADLEKFEVTQVADADELDTNPFQRCTLTIKDDKGREFTTNTPNLIRMVTQFIYDACIEKKKELEAKIVFPA